MWAGTSSTPSRSAPSVNDNLAVANVLGTDAEDRDVARRRFLNSGVGYTRARCSGTTTPSRARRTSPPGRSSRRVPTGHMDAMLDIGSAIVGEPDDVVDQLKIRSPVSNGDGAAASLAIALRKTRAWLQLVARCLLFGA